MAGNWRAAVLFLALPIIAILKIIFDRIESLKPWGLLLGDEETTEKPQVAGGRPQPQSLLRNRMATTLKPVTAVE